MVFSRPGGGGWNAKPPVDVPAEVREEYEELLLGSVDTLPAEELSSAGRARAAGRPLRVKLGVDPTAPDIHFGHTVVLRKLAQFQASVTRRSSSSVTTRQRLGTHRADRSSDRDSPTKRSTRTLLTYVEQAAKVLDMDKVEFPRNGEWLGPLRMDEVLSLTATITVARMLERDDFSRRYLANEPISMLEFMYPLLQGYDSVAVRADVELGGRTRSSTCSWGERSWKLTACHPEHPHAYPFWSAPMASRRCRSPTATTSE